MSSDFDPHLGHSITSGQYDLKNYNVVRNLVRSLTRGGARALSDVSSDRPTRELVQEGTQAVPGPKEEDLLKAMDEQPVEPESGPEPTSEADPAVPDEPLGASLKDASEIVDQSTQPQESVDFDLPSRGSMPAEEYAEKAAKVEVSKLEARTRERNINLDYIENADDIGRFLEINSQTIPAVARQSLDEVQQQVDSGGAVEILRDVLTEKPAALSAGQLLAGRQVLVSMTDEISKLANKILNETESNPVSRQEKLRFEKLQEQAVMLQEFMQGKIREAGRALNAMKITARVVNSGNPQQMAEILNEQSLVTRAQLVRDMEEAGLSPGRQIEEMSRTSKLKSLTAALVNYRNAAILTGFKTQGVNFISNTVYGTIQTAAIKPMAAAIGRVRSAMTGNEERVFLGEAAAEGAAFFEGVGDAIRMGAKVWKDGTFTNKGEYISSFGGRKIDETVDTSPLTGTALNEMAGNKLSMTGIPQSLDAIQRTTESISYGLLTASDEFFKSIAYRKSLYSQAFRQASVEKAQDVPARANELLNNVTKEMHDEAIKYAEQVTFTNRDVTPWLRMTADFLVKSGEMFPPMKIFVPFVRTPTSIFDRSIKMSPLAPLQKDFYSRLNQGGAEADMALAELSMGTMLAAWAYFMVNAGLMTGNGPGYDDVGARNRLDALEKTGWQSTSINIGGSMVSYQRGFEPMTIPLVGIASYMEKLLYEQDELKAQEMAGGAILAMAAHFKDNTYMQGISDIINLMDGRVNFSSLGAKTAGSFVPSLLRDARSIEQGLSGEEQSPYTPKSHNFWELLTQEVAYRVPGTETRAIKRYWDGTPVIAGGGEALFLYNSISPVRISNVQGKGERYYDEANNELVANGVGPSEPSSEIGLESQSGVKVDLLELDGGVELFDKMLEIVGDYRRQSVEALIKQPAYQNAEGGPNSWKSAMLERALGQGLRVGKQAFFGWLLEQDLDPNKYGEAAELLTPEGLKRLVNAEASGMTTPEETELLQKSGMKGVSSRRELPVPRYDPNL